MRSFAERSTRGNLLASSPGFNTWPETDPGPLAHYDHEVPADHLAGQRERPAPDYVWVKGFYDWQGEGWVWTPGHWIAPPARSVRWVSPRYVRVEDGWWYEPAHWSNQQLVVDEKVKKEKFKVKKEKKMKKEKVKKEKIKD